MQKRLIVNCALPYSNGFLHVGHIAGCYLPADIFVRYQKLNGRRVRFICGSDDHGVPIKLTADKEGKEPQEIASFYNAQQQSDFQSLGINFDIYGSTCASPYHEKTSQDFFNVLYSKGYFTKRTSQQFYDETNNMFLPDRYVKGTCAYCGAKDQNSDQCEECGKELDVAHLDDAYSAISNEPASIKETAHWYLDLTKFSSIVENWLAGATTRSHTKSFVKGLINTGLVERAMTRDLDWGIKLPIDDPEALNKVLYVWFDAPIGYISNTKEVCAKLEGDPEKYVDWWKSDDCDLYHYIGEDNTVFHCVIWIAMLSAEGSFSLPKGVIVNQFVNIQMSNESDEEKISKSRGNAIWINEYIAEGGNPDSLRYYLTCIAPEKSRSVYNPEDLIKKHNSELANSLGNFVNRVVTFYQKHFGNEVKAINHEFDDQTDKDFDKSRKEIAAEVGKLIEQHSYKAAQDKLFEFIRSCNLYMDKKSPWNQKKENPELAQHTLIFCLNAIYTISIAMEPFMPFTTAKIRNILGIGEKDLQWQDAESYLQETSMNEPEILFEKILDE